MKQQVDLNNYQGYRVEISLADALQMGMGSMDGGNLPKSIDELERIKVVAIDERPTRQPAKRGYLAVVGSEVSPFWSTDHPIEVKTYEDISAGKVAVRTFPSAGRRVW